MNEVAIAAHEIAAQQARGDRSGEGIKWTATTYAIQFDDYSQR